MKLSEQNALDFFNGKHFDGYIQEDLYHTNHNTYDRIMSYTGILQFRGKYYQYSLFKKYEYLGVFNYKEEEKFSRCRYWGEVKPKRVWCSI